MPGSQTRHSYRNCSHFESTPVRALDILIAALGSAPPPPPFARPPPPKSIEYTLSKNVRRMYCKHPKPHHFSFYVTQKRKANVHASVQYSAAAGGLRYIPYKQPSGSTKGCPQHLPRRFRPSQRIKAKTATGSSLVQFR